MKPVVKVWLYIVRLTGPQPELLVFEQLHANAGIQVPAGTVEAGETPEAAAARELFEESGVRIDSFEHLREIQREWYGQAVHAHLFWQHAPDALPDEWEHRVTGKGEDHDMLFRCFWLRRAEWHKLFGDFKEAFPALERALTRAGSMETI